MAISRPLGATSRVIFELKPFGVSIMGANGSQPWVGRSTAQMSGNPSAHGDISSKDDESGEILDKFRNRFEINRESRG